MVCSNSSYQSKQGNSSIDQIVSELRHNISTIFEFRNNVSEVLELRENVSTLHQVLEDQNKTIIALQTELKTQQYKNNVLDSTLSQVIRISLEMQGNVSTAQNDIARIKHTLNKTLNFNTGSCDQRTIYDKISEVEDQLNQTSEASALMFADLAAKVNICQSQLTKHQNNISGLETRNVGVMAQMQSLNASLALVKGRQNNISIMYNHVVVKQLQSLTTSLGHLDYTLKHSKS